MGQVTIIELGRTPRTIDVPSGTALSAALQSHDINTAGVSALVDGTRVEMDASLMGGETVTLTTKAAGGC